MLRHIRVCTCTCPHTPDYALSTQKSSYHVEQRNQPWGSGAPASTNLTVPRNHVGSPQHFIRRKQNITTLLPVSFPFSIFLDHFWDPKILPVSLNMDVSLMTALLVSRHGAVDIWKTLVIWTGCHQQLAFRWVCWKHRCVRFSETNNQWSTHSWSERLNPELPPFCT